MSVVYRAPKRRACQIDNAADAIGIFKREGERVMKAIPKRVTEDIRKLLPRHLHGNTGGQGDQMFPDNSRGQHHAAVPELISNALGSQTRPNAERENRQLNTDILQALSDNKRLNEADMG